MKIAFNGVKIKAKKYKKDILKKVSEVIDRGVFLNGPENQELIKSLEKYLLAGHLITTSSGHNALLIALRRLPIGPDDEVIFPVNVYPTAFAVAQSGAIPVPVDVDHNGLIDINEIKKKITKRTKTIVVVHLYGLVVDLDEIKKIIKGKDIILIEDCAQAFGSLYKNKPVGTFGDISCFSFYPTKNLATLGNGGAIWCRDEKLYEYFKKAVAYGAATIYKSEFVAGHSRLSEIQASVLNIYFKDFKNECRTRGKIAKQYEKSFERYPSLARVNLLLNSAKDSSPALHLFVVECEKRDKLKAYLSKKNIETHIHYPEPVHLLKAFAHLKYKERSFPKAEYLSRRILSLPFHSYLTQEEIDYIAKSIKEFYD